MTAPADVPFEPLARGVDEAHAEAGNVATHECVPVVAGAERAYLLAGIAWQDALLASYRTLTVGVAGALLVTQAVLAVGAGLSGARWLYAVGATVIGVLGIASVWRMHAVARHRAADVNWWQARLLDTELVAGGGMLSAFKSAQHARAGLDPTGREPVGCEPAGPGEDERFTSADLLHKSRHHVRAALSGALYGSVYVAFAGVAGVAVLVAALTS